MNAGVRRTSRYSAALSAAQQALARIVAAANQLRCGICFPTFSTKLHDARDRALLSESAGTRVRVGGCVTAAALDRLLEHPLRERDAAVRALAVLGLVQIEVLGLPEYAAVAATVEAARALHRPRLAGLINALLRRWLRERAILQTTLDADEVTRTAHPRWLIEAIPRAIGR